VNEQLTALMAGITPTTMLAASVAAVGLLVIVTTLISNRRQRRQIERLIEDASILSAEVRDLRKEKDPRG